MAKLDDPSQECVCNKCGFKARAIPDRQHRRCPGTRGESPRAFDKRVKRADRGKWMLASFGSEDEE